VSEPRLEIYDPPRFTPGDGVRATTAVRNDGTVPGLERGDWVVSAGERGYVRDVGIFLQRFYVYAVEFVDRGAIVGMRAHELDRDESAEVAR
jgi:nitrogen fixation protein NifZ